MQKQSISRTELMSSFQALQGQFDQQRSDIQNKQAAFDQLRQDFAGQLKLRSKNLEQIVGSENPLQELANSLADRLKGTFDCWEVQVASRVKGTRFREGFGDSLLVFIYGKVKSGKSSLGNYMAWGHSEPGVEHKSHNHQPAYFSTEQTAVASGDQEKEAESAKQFRVGATEATSSIQGFSLPGLTWVDSPGLHSVNACNGDLAKEYVEHADLILYTMNSQAPGRASDMQEIAALLNSNKKIMVLLSGSDTTDEDEDADGNIVTTVQMKDLSDRQDQIAYVQGELQQLNNSASVLAEVLSISTRYAERNPTAEGMTESGMGRLMQELQAICSSQALSIKLNTPMDNLRCSIRVTADELSGVQEMIDAFGKSISKQHDDLQGDLASLGVQGASQMRSFINQLFDAGGNDDLNTELRNKAGEIISQLALEAFSKIGERQQQGFKQAFDSSRLSSLPEYQEITEEKAYFVGTKKSNKGLLGLFGAALGGVVGFALGGPGGAALGASLGGAASAAGRSASAEYGHHQVVVGDNKEDRRQAAIEGYSNTITSLLTEYVNALYEPVFKGMLGYCKDVENDMTDLLDKIEHLVQEGN